MTFQLPARLAFETAASGAPRKGLVIAGTPGSVGDAGWAVFTCADLADALDVMASYPQARMPCWQRIEARAAAEAV
jgi:hypothetical protein